VLVRAAAGDGEGGEACWFGRAADDGKGGEVCELVRPAASEGEGGEKMGAARRWKTRHVRSK
jgi:hypothetical protein